MKTINEQSIQSLLKSLHPTGKASSPNLSINRGDVFKGRVLKTLPPGHAILAIRGERLIAETRVPLKEGDVVSLRVQQVNPQTILKMVGRIEQEVSPAGDLARLNGFYKGFPFRHISDLMASLMGVGKGAADKNIPEAIMRIWDQFQAVSVVPGKVETPKLLEKVLCDSGLMWEGKLKSLFCSQRASVPAKMASLGGDLKGLVLAALMNCRELDMVGGESLRHFLDGLEQLQLANVWAVENKGKCLFVLPISWDDEIRFGQLLTDLSQESRADEGDDEGKQGKNKSYQICLLLDMSNLGTVRVDASILGKVVKVNFLVSDEALRERFEKAVPHLTEILEGRGFSIQQVTCRSTRASETMSVSLLDDILEREWHHISLVV